MLTERNFNTCGSVISTFHCTGTQSQVILGTHNTGCEQHTQLFINAEVGGTRFTRPTAKLMGSSRKKAYPSSRFLVAYLLLYQVRFHAFRLAPEPRARDCWADMHVKGTRHKVLCMTCSDYSKAFVNVSYQASLCFALSKHIFQLLKPAAAVLPIPSKQDE
jgi:hypothetical protein